MRNAKLITKLLTRFNISKKRRNLILISTILIILIIFIFLFINYNDNSNNFLSNISGFTNSSDQEYILLSHEFENKKYTKVIDFIDIFFEKKSLNEDNIKILLLKIETKEKLIQELNRKYTKNRWKTAKKYNFKIRKNRIYYDYKELKTIWEKFPNTSYGKDVFYKYIGKVTEQKEKINYYEDFVDNIKDKKFRNKLRFELSNIYLQTLIDLKGKKAKKLNKLYDKLLKTEYKNKIIINSIILKYIIVGENTRYKMEITALLNEKNLTGLIANYLIGDVEFIDADLEESKKYFSQAKKMFKYVKKEDNIPLLFNQLEYFPDNSMKNLKITVNKKINLIEKLIEYHQTPKDKKIAFIVGERVRIRKEPVILRRNVITTLNYGDKVTIIKKSNKKEKLEGEENYWYYIQLRENTKGWIFGKYLQFFIY